MECPQTKGKPSDYAHMNQAERSHTQGPCGRLLGEAPKSAGYQLGERERERDRERERERDRS